MLTETIRNINCWNVLFCWRRCSSALIIYNLLSFQSPAYSSPILTLMWFCPDLIFYVNFLLLTSFYSSVRQSLPLSNWTCPLLCPMHLMLLFSVHMKRQQYMEYKQSPLQCATRYQCDIFAYFCVYFMSIFVPTFVSTLCLSLCLLLCLYYVYFYAYLCVYFMSAFVPTVLSTLLRLPLCLPSWLFSFVTI